MTQITALQWADYKSIINEAHNTFNQQSLIWRKFNASLNRDGEDIPGSVSNINILGLIKYNDFKTWPSDYNTESGSLDRENEVLILNLKYLRDNGWLNSNGNFDYDVSMDRFIHDGIIYKSTGETKICQAQDEPLLVMLILKREETNTGSDNN